MLTHPPLHLPQTASSSISTTASSGCNEQYGLQYGLEFLDPPRSPFYAYGTGRNSPYGEQTLALLRSLAESGGLHAVDYAQVIGPSGMHHIALCARVPTHVGCVVGGCDHIAICPSATWLCCPPGRPIVMSIPRPSTYTMRCWPSSVGTCVCSSQPSSMPTQPCWHGHARTGMLHLFVVLPLCAGVCRDVWRRL